jgi:splicing factor 3B subunit 1
VLQYLLAGLFHPARKVREVYWRHYNALYVGAGDALVPAFPALPADAAGGAHLRHELDVFV